MNRRKAILFILIVLPFFLSLTYKEEAQASHTLELAGKVINFVILFGGLYFLLHKPVRNFLEAKAQNINRSIKEAKREREESEAKLKEVLSRLEGLSEEVLEIEKKAEREAQKEKERIAELTRKEGERLKNLTRIEIESLYQAGIQELKEYTAEIITNLALKKIQKSITPRSQTLLIDKSIEKLENIYEKPSSGQNIHTRVN